MRHLFTRIWQQRLQRDTLLLLTLQTFYRLSGVIILGVLSRCLPAEDIGVYFFALSIAESVTLLSSFRLNTVLLRRVAEHPAQAATHCAAALGLRLACSPLYFLIVAIVTMALARPIWWVVLLTACSTLMEDGYFSFMHCFLGLGKAVYNVAIGLLVQVIFLGVFLLGMEWAPSLAMFLAANALRALGLLIGGMFVTQRWLFPLRLRWDSSLIKEGTPFLLLTLLAMLRDRLDTLLLGFYTDYDTVGQYQLAFRIVFTSFFVPAVVGQAFFPQLAAHGLHAENRRLFWYQTLALCGVSGLGVGLVYLWAAPLTTLLYGPQAAAVATLLYPLAWQLPLSFLLIFFATALQALHQESAVLKALAIGAGVSVVANGALIPRWGVQGMIYAGLGIVLIQLWLLARHLYPLLARQTIRAASSRPSDSQQPQGATLLTQRDGLRYSSVSKEGE